LSHSISPFCIGYFWDRVSPYDRAGMDCNPPICASLHSCDEKHTLLSSAIGWEVSQLFCLRWPWMAILQIYLCLTSS
jgi:hypothetical protein